jgi:predicted transglutaminase-like cysteine proteinase
MKNWIAIGIAVAVATAGMRLAKPASATGEKVLFASVGASTRPPIGWLGFCNEYPRECDTKPILPRDLAVTPKAWTALLLINSLVNHTIKPMSDLEHWGVVDRWNYAEDGYGDCEDYVLLKRRLLMRAGWPRQALLVTVVLSIRGNGHALLTVKTDKGEFILDNQSDEVLLWSQTAYRFIKRQSQLDPNVWVTVETPRPATASTMSR